MEKKWMCHPELPGQPIEVGEEAVSHYSHSGWLLMDGPPAEPEGKPVARATVHGEPYEGEPADKESMRLPVGNAEAKSSPDDDEDSDDKSTGTRRVRRSTSKGDDK